MSMDLSSLKAHMRSELLQTVRPEETAEQERPHRSVPPPSLTCLWLVLLAFRSSTVL